MPKRSVKQKVKYGNNIFEVMFYKQSVCYASNIKTFFYNKNFFLQKIHKNTFFYFICKISQNFHQKNPLSINQDTEGCSVFRSKNCVLILGWWTVDHQETQTVTSCDHPLFLPLVPNARKWKVIWLPSFKSEIIIVLAVL